MLQVEEPDTVKWFRHQAGWASGVCSQKEWVTESAQEGKRRESTAQDEGDREGSLSSKAARRQDAKTSALPRSDEGGDGVPVDDFTLPIFSMLPYE